MATVRESDGVLLSEAYGINPFAAEEKGKGIKVSEWLLEKGVDTVYTPKGFEGKGPGYVFSDGGVAVMLTRDRRLEAIQRDIQHIPAVNSADSGTPSPAQSPGAST